MLGVVGWGALPAGHLNTRATFGQVFSVEVAIAIAVFAVICAVVAVALLRARRRQAPTGASSHPRTEAAAIGVVALVAAFLVTLSFTANSRPDPRPSLRVSVTAFQWCWRFNYTGTGVSVTGQCTNRDIPTLVLPTDRVIRVDITSTDVVHSMWVPYLRFKMQAFPDHVNSFDTTISTVGTFAGRCAEFCGLYHYAMDFTLKTLPPARFDAWLRAQEALR